MRPPPRRLFRHRPPAPAVAMTAAAIDAIEHAVPGRLVELATLHDDWCRFLGGKGPCNCSPEVKTMAEHRRHQAERN